MRKSEKRGGKDNGLEVCGPEQEKDCDRLGITTFPQKGYRLAQKKAEGYRQQG